MTYITIILSTYNHETTIGPCLESIIAQENADLKMECIIVDDCSTDNTLAVIRRQVGEYKGNISFRIFRHQSHHGLARTRNTGLERAQGYYVLFVNGADRLRPECIDTYMVTLMRHWDADVIVGNAFLTSLNRNIFSQLTSARVLRGRGVVIAHEMLRSHLYLYANNKLVRRELLTASQISFDEHLDFCDIQWAFALFAAVGSVVLMPDITYEYGKRENSSISQTEKSVNALLNSYLATSEHLLDTAPRPESDDGGYYQAHQLFIFALLSHASRLTEEFNVNSQVKRGLSAVQSRLLSQTKNDGQKMLYLFFKQEGSVISGLFKNSSFRNYRQTISEMMALLDVLVGR